MKTESGNASTLISVLFLGLNQAKVRFGPSLGQSLKWLPRLLRSDQVHSILSLTICPRMASGQVKTSAIQLKESKSKTAKSLVYPRRKSASYGRFKLAGMSHRSI